MIEIIPYREEWATEFREIAGVLRRGLGTTARRIDHIGSTAVAGLAAKDVIDIQVSVVALDERLLEQMARLGYSRAAHIDRDHRPPASAAPESEWTKWFFRPPGGQRPTNAHVRIAGRANERYSLLVRDYLRAHPATAAAYAELKRRLAKELCDASDYLDVKDPAVDLIYLAAEEWAAAGWQMGPADA
jgi:GrpB-like predicted nucleotidyltransferase (UPF0157 family)